MPQLQDLRTQIDSAIAQRRKTEKANAKQELLNFARERGFDLNELIATGKRVSARAGKPVPIKYKSKTNPSDTWTGRGRAPKWVQEYTNQGGKLEDLAV